MAAALDVSAELKTLTDAELIDEIGKLQEAIAYGDGAAATPGLMLKVLEAAKAEMRRRQALTAAEGIRDRAIAANLGDNDADEIAQALRVADRYIKVGNIDSAVWALDIANEILKDATR